jgi:hypothetical protein
MEMMNKEERIKDFEDFWPYYVREHKAAGCRLLHFIGSAAGIVCLVSTFVTGNLWFIPLGLGLGYGFAWIGHFFVERNRPATFQYPLWSFRADWRMWRFMLLGRMRKGSSASRAPFDGERYGCIQQSSIHRNVLSVV